MTYLFFKYKILIEITKEMYSFIYFYIFCLNYPIKSGIIKSNCINNNKKYESRGEINMRKLNLITVVLVLLISVMVMLFTTTVNAANENNGFTDITSELTPTNNTPTNNTPTNNTQNNNTPTNNTPKNNTNNSSVYNNTNLPHTGIEESVPVAMLVVVFGISALYAYKKIREYKNI